ncbi:hypothetical protein KUTeg_004135 [Tegillarca granosa]|uniref:EF-hand domain-containing protein n=1 Tax=Tegillarca granosa TaxID=220873 RepID=A0ABQ9FP37_TEGGR|nr:hypothetical protein KUTeg_004135 [Tegillarca granosa]
MERQRPAIIVASPEPPSFTLFAINLPKCQQCNKTLPDMIQKFVPQPAIVGLRYVPIREAMICYCYPTIGDYVRVANCVNIRNIGSQVMNTQNMVLDSQELTDLLNFSQNGSVNFNFLSQDIGGSPTHTPSKNINPTRKRSGLFESILPNDYDSGDEFQTGGNLKRRKKSKVQKEKRKNPRTLPKKSKENTTNTVRNPKKKEEKIKDNNLENEYVLDLKDKMFSPKLNAFMILYVVKLTNVWLNRNIKSHFHALKRVIDNVLINISVNSDPYEDVIQISINQIGFKNPLFLKFRKIGELKSSYVVEQLKKTLMSTPDVSFNDTFEITIRLSQRSESDLSLPSDNDESSDLDGDDNSDQQNQNDDNVDNSQHISDNNNDNNMSLNEEFETNMSDMTLDSQNFILKEKKRILRRKFNVEEIMYEIKLKDTLLNKKWSEHMITLHSIFDMCLEHATKGLNSNEDLIRVFINQEGLETPINIPLRPIQLMTADEILLEIEKVLQSNKNLIFDRTFYIHIATIDLPKGSGLSEKVRHRVGPWADSKKKHCIIEIKRDASHLCFARSLVVGLAYLNKTKKEQIKIKAKERYQIQKATDLLHDVGFNPDRPVNLNDIPLFENHLNIQIKIVSANAFNKIVYKDNHYNLIVPGKLHAFFSKSYYCYGCDTPYQDKYSHRCEMTCKVCQRSKSVCVDNVFIECNDCKRTVRNNDCYTFHRVKPYDRVHKKWCKISNSILPKPNTIPLVPNDGMICKDQYSKISLCWLDYLMFKDPNLKIQHAGNGSEYRYKNYRFDGYVPPNVENEHKGTVFEFLGCKFHAHPECVNTKNKLYLKDIYTKTIERQKELENDEFATKEPFTINSPLSFQLNCLLRLLFKMSNNTTCAKDILFCVYSLSMGLTGKRFSKLKQYNAYPSIYYQVETQNSFLCYMLYLNLQPRLLSFEPLVYLLCQENTLLNHYLLPVIKDFCGPAVIEKSVPKTHAFDKEKDDEKKNEGEKKEEIKEEEEEAEDDDEKRMSAICNYLAKKDKDKKKEKKKYTTVEPALLMAFTYFDQNHTGYMLDKDVEEIIHTIGLQLSRAQIYNCPEHRYVQSIDLQLSRAQIYNCPEHRYMYLQSIDLQLSRAQIYNCPAHRYVQSIDLQLSRAQIYNCPEHRYVQSIDLQLSRAQIYNCPAHRYVQSIDLQLSRAQIYNCPAHRYVQSIDLQLSRAQVRKLVQKVVSRDAVSYRKLTDKPLPGQGDTKEEPVKEVKEFDIETLAQGLYICIGPYKVLKSLIYNTIDLYFFMRGSVIFSKPSIVTG